MSLEGDSREDARPDEGRERDRKRVEGKMAWAERRREAFRQAPELGEERLRLPPDQRWVDGWPVLDLGDQPEIRLEDWRLTVDGAVEEPREFDFESLRALGVRECRRDFHCVTTWSTKDNLWTGVPFRALLDVVRPRPEATHVLFHGADRAPDAGVHYTTNVPLDDLVDEEVMIVWSRNGEVLSREHGGPVRMIVPALYAWKSAKWLVGVTLMEGDRPGYWEERGYSMTARPWENDRFSGDGPPDSFEVE